MRFDLRSVVPVAVVLVVAAFAGSGAAENRKTEAQVAAEQLRAQATAMQTTVTTLRAQVLQLSAAATADKKAAGALTDPDVKVALTNLANKLDSQATDFQMKAHDDEILALEMLRLASRISP